MADPIISDDGRWLWDGKEWIPNPPKVTPTPPPMTSPNPPMNQSQSQGLVFLTPSEDYSRLTAQVGFLGNHILASDMRSIPLSGTNPIAMIIYFIISFFLIVLVVPMVLFLAYAMRESRNNQRRKQMMQSAVLFVQTTPVPVEKTHLASQFGP
jgi:hypothetical protein